VFPSLILSKYIPFLADVSLEIPEFLLANEESGHNRFLKKPFGLTYTKLRATRRITL
jgi:hypothetical protein